MLYDLSHKEGRKRPGNEHKQKALPPMNASPRTLTCHAPRYSSQVLVRMTRTLGLATNTTIEMLQLTGTVSHRHGRGESLLRSFLHRYPTKCLHPTQSINHGFILSTIRGSKQFSVRGWGGTAIHLRMSSLSPNLTRNGLTDPGSESRVYLIL